MSYGGPHDPQRSFRRLFSSAAASSGGRSFSSASAAARYGPLSHSANVSSGGGGLIGAAGGGVSASVVVGSSSSSSTGQTGDGSIEELLRCFICFGQVQDPRLCPSCSKMCCLACIERWLQRKHQCPFCRSSLSPSMLVNCRFMYDIYAELERIQGRQKTAQEAQNELCSEHDAPKHYFCTTCSDSICSDCAMFGTEHKGHEFERLSKVYKSNVDTVQHQIEQLNTRMQELLKMEGKIDQNIMSVKTAKEERLLEINSAFAEVDSRLSLQLKNKLLKLLSHKNDVVKEANLLESLQHELKRQLDVNTCSQTMLIKKTPDLLEMLKGIHSRSVCEVAPNEEVSAEFENELVPAYKTAVFTITDFAAARDKDTVLYSPPMVTTGLTWRLKVYPNGNGVARFGFISVFLELSSGFVGSSSKYDYRVNMLHASERSKSVSRVFSSTFDVGECWGYNRFFRIDCLEEEGYLDDAGSLQLEFSVRSPNFYHLCQDQTRYIEYLQGCHRDAQQAVESTVSAVAGGTDVDVSTVSAAATGAGATIGGAAVEVQAVQALEVGRVESKEHDLTLDSDAAYSTNTHGPPSQEPHERSAHTHTHTHTHTGGGTLRLLGSDSRYANARAQAIKLQSWMHPPPNGASSPADSSSVPEPASVAALHSGRQRRDRGTSSRYLDSDHGSDRQEQQQERGGQGQSRGRGPMLGGADDDDTETKESAQARASASAVGLDQMYDWLSGRDSSGAGLAGLAGVPPLSILDDYREYGDDEDFVAFVTASDDSGDEREHEEEEEELPPLRRPVQELDDDDVLGLGDSPMELAGTRASLFDPRTYEPAAAPASVESGTTAMPSAAGVAKSVTGLGSRRTSQLRDVSSAFFPRPAPSPAPAPAPVPAPGAADSSTATAAALAPVVADEAAPTAVDTGAAATAMSAASSSSSAVTSAAATAPAAAAVASASGSSAVAPPELARLPRRARARAPLKALDRTAARSLQNTHMSTTTVLRDGGAAESTQASAPVAAQATEDDCGVVSCTTSVTQEATASPQQRKQA